MSTLAVILENFTGSELDRKLVDGPASDDPDAAADLANHEAIEP